MSGFELPPGPSDWTPTDGSPFLPQPTGPVRSSAMDAPVPFQPTTGPPQQAPERSGSSAVLVALQEHVAILRQHLEAAEQDLDNCEPEQYAELKKALLQVSRMISQMECTANALAEKQRNLKNELRTLEDENVCLNEALLRERAKELDRMDQSPTSMAGGGFEMPTTPQGAWHICGVADNQLDEFWLGESGIPTYALADEDDSFMDLGALDNAATITCASMFDYSLEPTSGPSGAVKRGRQISPVDQNTNIVGSELRPSSAKRGRISSGATASPMPSGLVMTENNASTSSASTDAAMVPALESPGYAGPSTQSMQPIQAPFEILDVNDIEQIAEAANMRNNRHSWYDLLNMEELRHLYE